MTGIRSRFSALIVAGLLASTPRAGADALYSVKGLDLTAHSISNAGQIVGDIPSQSYLPYSAIETDGVVRPITDPTTGASVWGAVISPGGTIAYNTVQLQIGFADVLKDGQATSSGFLPTTAPNPYSIPTAVNDSGAVAGS